MSTLNAYIARLYLVNTAALLLLLFGFVVTVDVITNLDNFTESAQALAASAGDEQASAKGVLQRILLTVIAIVDIWGPRLLQLFNYLNGVVLIAAMGFTCSQLVRNREFVAMLAGGISLFRVARPFAYVAVLFAGIQVLNQEVLLPKVAPLLTRDAGEAGERDLASFPVRLVSENNLRLTAESFDGSFEQDGSGNRVARLTELVAFELGDDNAVQRIITADSAVWDGLGWVLTGGMQEIPPSSPLFEGELRAPAERLNTNLDPLRLRALSSLEYAQNLSFTELSIMLDAQRLNAKTAERLNRLRWGRFASVAANTFTLFAAMPFFLLRWPRPLLISSLKAAPIAMLGLAASAASTTLPLPGLPIWLGVFVPTILLLAVAIGLFTSIRT